MKELLSGGANVIDKIRLFLLTTGVVLTAYYSIFDVINRSSFENAPILGVCLLGLVAGIVLHKSGKKKAASFLYLIPSQIFMTFLIYQSGGIKAPGVFWFSMLPVIWAMLVGTRGLMIGYSSIIITFLYFYVNYPSIPFPDHFMEGNFLFRARLENLIVFSTFVFVFILIYTWILADARKKIENKREEVSTLLRILVHDISTPMTVASGQIEIMEMTEDYNKKGFTEVAHSMERVNQIISDVRRLYAISDGKLALQLAPTDLNFCVDEALMTVKGALEKKKIKVNFTFGDGVSQALVDRSIFANQVLVNILTNAIKFSKEGQEISIDLFESEGAVYLDVIDQGVGIPPDIIANLFRTDVPTTRKGTAGESGTGFGLPIVKQIVEQHEGSLQVYSPPTKKYETGTMIRLKMKNVNQHSEIPDPKKRKSGLFRIKELQSS